MKHLLCSLTVLLALTACASLRRGDLLFHVAEHDNAVTAVTPGMVDHVAIYAGWGRVVEALPRQGVVVSWIDQMRLREQGYFLVARVKHVDGRRSVERARAFQGQPYDSLFLAGNDAIYCSELVQLSLVDKKGRPLLGTVPMTFRDSLGRIPDYWQQLYSRHGMSVPEGQPGSNPAELMKRANVKVIKSLR